MKIIHRTLVVPVSSSSSFATNFAASRQLVAYSAEAKLVTELLWNNRMLRCRLLGGSNARYCGIME